MKNKRFDIKRTNADRYSYIVLSTSYMSPIEWVEELEACLMKEEYVGNILLDLLLSNGYDRDRFYEIFFDGKKLNFQTLLNVTKVSEELKQVSGEYYSRNSEILDNSVLTKPQRFLIKKKRLL
ncbi:type II toxin-antitoxin system RnlB family antitoxin [Desulfobacter postgatei]|uniref:Antitoxin to toxin RNase LS or RnlA n=1 Tax=Desulfobacter postgatei 2ac9 TaxID=879212 RepID=I5B0B1_9BACT|nr:hypothetical protein DespoDRAFT_00947 [Desulfobacter postgatei 2ac9]